MVSDEIEDPFLSFFGLPGMFGAQTFFKKVWGNSDKVLSHTQKFVCFYTYGY